MTAPQWFSGPPPAVGWWPASIGAKFTDVYRWWDGSEWSQPAFASYHASISSDVAHLKSHNNDRMLWRHWSIDIDGTDGRGAHE